MLSYRLRQKRLYNGMSLQDLANTMAKEGVSISPMTLYNYEVGKTEPDSDTLAVIQRVLSVDNGFLEADSCPDLESYFFKEPNLIQKRKSEFSAFIKINVEQHLDVDRMLGIETKTERPSPIKVDTFDIEQIEAAADQFRADYGAGELPISSVCGLLEQNGWYIFPSNASIEGTVLGGFTEHSKHLFLMYEPVEYTDLLRHSMLREVGYLLFDCDDPALRTEVCEAFADAVLMSRASVTKLFGQKTGCLNLFQATMIKQAYGIARNRITKRLFRLGLISEEEFTAFQTLARKYRYIYGSQMERTTFQPLGFTEEPQIYMFKVHRAAMLGFITTEKAKQLCPRLLSQDIFSPTW